VVVGIPSDGEVEMAFLEGLRAHLLHILGMEVGWEEEEGMLWFLAQHIL